MRSITNFVDQVMTASKLIVPAAAMLLAGAAHADLTGKSFAAYYGYPDSTTVYDKATATPSSFTVGPGVETIFEIEGVTWVSVDFSDTSLKLVLTTVLTNPKWNSASFNGPVFDLTAGSALDIGSAAVDPATTLAGFDSSRVSFDAGRIAINWGRLSYTDGSTVVVNFTPAVPEPSAWLMALGGLALLGAQRRIRSQTKRARQSAAVRSAA